MTESSSPKRTNARMSFWRLIGHLIVAILLKVPTRPNGELLYNKYE